MIVLHVLIGFYMATRILTVQAYHDNLEVTLAASADTRIAYTKISVKGTNKDENAS